MLLRSPLWTKSVISVPIRAGRVHDWTVECLLYNNAVQHETEQTDVY